MLAMPDLKLHSSVGIAIGLRGLGALSAFGMNVVFGRLLGVDGAGLFYLALSVSSVGSVVARLGLDQSILRFVSAEIAAGSPARGWAAFRAGVLATTAASLVLVGLVFLLAHPIADTLFNEPDLVGPLRVMSPAILTFSLMTLVAESLKGLKRFVMAMLVSGVIYPAAGIVLAWPLVATFGPAGATLAYVLATGFAATVGLLAFWRAYPDRAGPGDVAPATLARSAFPLWIAAIINRAVLPWMPLILLGVWGTTSDAGVFGAAARIANQISFFLIAVNTILAPRFSELYASGRLAEIGPLARHFALVTIVATAPVFLLLILRGDLVMALFGPQFRSGGLVLAVLALGQLVSVLSGSVNDVLAMTGNEHAVRNAALVAAMVTVLLAVTLIPPYGALGAAAATACGLSLARVVAMIYAKRRLGFLTWASIR